MPTNPDLWSTTLKCYAHGAYKFGKMKFPEFSTFLDPLNSLFHTSIMLKPDVTNHLTSHFGTFLALMQNYRIYFKEHGDWLHPRQSLCHTTKLCYCVRLRHRNIPSDFQKFPEYVSNFPEFSRIKQIPAFSRFPRVVSTLYAMTTKRCWLTVTISAISDQHEGKTVIKHNAFDDSVGWQRQICLCRQSIALT